VASRGRAQRMTRTSTPFRDRPRCDRHRSGRSREAAGSSSRRQAFRTDCRHKSGCQCPAGVKGYDLDRCFANPLRKRSCPRANRPGTSHRLTGRRRSGPRPPRRVPVPPHGTGMPAEPRRPVRSLPPHQARVRQDGAHNRMHARTSSGVRTATARSRKCTPIVCSACNAYNTGRCPPDVFPGSGSPFCA
jgi:hypothetical protein